MDKTTQTQILSAWARQILTELEGEPQDFGDATAAVLGVLSGGFEDGEGSWTGSYGEIGHYLELRRKTVAASVVWLIARGFLSRESVGPAGYRYEPRRAVPCADGPLAGRVARIRITSEHGSRHALDGIAVYVLRGDELAFQWPLLSGALFRGGPLAGELRPGWQIQNEWAELEVQGDHGTYRRASDGHFDYFEPLPSEFDHEAFEREFGAYTEGER